MHTGGTRVKTKARDWGDASISRGARSSDCQALGREHGADPLTQLTALRGTPDFWPLELPEDLEGTEVQQSNLVPGALG